MFEIDMSQLKNCPFCGERPYFGGRMGDGSYRISCTCGANVQRNNKAEWYEQIDGSVYVKHDFESAMDCAIAAWNRRANM